MRDLDLFDFIETKIGEEDFLDIKLLNKEITGHGFSILSYEYKEVKINFVIDRGYLEGEFFKNGISIPFSKLNPALKNLKKNADSVILIINFLSENKNKYFT